MGSILSPNKGLQLPNGLTERREQERLEKVAPLASEEEEKAKHDFAVFLEEHNVIFEVHFDVRETPHGKKKIGQGLTFISKLWQPQESQIFH